MNVNLCAIYTYFCLISLEISLKFETITAKITNAMPVSSFICKVSVYMMYPKIPLKKISSESIIDPKYKLKFLNPTTVKYSARKVTDTKESNNSNVFSDIGVTLSPLSIATINMITAEYEEVNKRKSTFSSFVKLFLRKLETQYIIPLIVPYINPVFKSDKLFIFERK